MHVFSTNSKQSHLVFVLLIVLHRCINNGGRKHCVDICPRQIIEKCSGFLKTMFPEKVLFCFCQIKGESTLRWMSKLINLSCFGFLHLIYIQVNKELWVSLGLKLLRLLLWQYGVGTSYTNTPVDIQISSMDTKFMYPAKKFYKLILSARFSFIMMWREIGCLYCIIWKCFALICTHILEFHQDTRHYVEVYALYFKGLNNTYKMFQSVVNTLKQ